jgi:hypothetical protein
MPETTWAEDADAVCEELLRYSTYRYRLGCTPAESARWLHIPATRAMKYEAAVMRLVEDLKTPAGEATT